MKVELVWEVLHRQCPVVNKAGYPLGKAKASLLVDLPVKTPLDLRDEKKRPKAQDAVLQALQAAPAYQCNRCLQGFRDADPGHTAQFLVLGCWLGGDEESAVAFMGHQGRPDYWDTSRTV